MSLWEILFGSGLGVVGLLTLVQVVPIKINPWSALARAIGKAINKDVLIRLDTLEGRLEEHIKTDDQRNADEHRHRILSFNSELIQNIPHTREEFIEILAEIDLYESYCKDHPEYKNTRCAHAVANIGRVYDDRLKQHDFA